PQCTDGDSYALPDSPVLCPAAPPSQPAVPATSRDPPPPAPSTLSLHDALPISTAEIAGCRREEVSEQFASVAEKMVAARVLDIGDRKSTRLNSSHVSTSYAVFCLQKNDQKTVYRWAHHT